MPILKIWRIEVSTKDKKTVAVPILTIFNHFHYLKFVEGKEDRDQNFRILEETIE